MLEFQGVSKDVADKLCCYSTKNNLMNQVLPSSKFVTKIIAREDGIIKLVDASIIAR
jgi:hypothetical protein